LNKAVKKQNVRMIVKIKLNTIQTTKV